MARVFYVLISTITVLIGFYDLYKNVPVLKATALRLFGPFSDWTENWEMVSRIQYLGTMLFLQNFEKAIWWLLMMTRGIRSMLLVLTKPFAGPLLDLMELISPVWNLCVDFGEDMGSVIYSILVSLQIIYLFILDAIIWPFWFIGMFFNMFFFSTIISLSAILSLLFVVFH
jgi:hypothetical protein